MADSRGVWRECHRHPELVLSPDELRLLSDVKGKRVCVLGSGDNEVAFALAGMGGRVTSVDISERQLEIAEERAQMLDLDLGFIRADVIDLSVIRDETFDVVYTGGHLSVWVSSIERYYSEAVRVLRPGGLFVVNDYYPVRRMWHESDGSGPRFGYFERGPHEYETEEGMTQVEFHWTIAGHLQAAIDAGCELLEVREHGECREPAEYARFVPPSLPSYLLIAGRKR